MRSLIFLLAISVFQIAFARSFARQSIHAANQPGIEPRTGQFVAATRAPLETLRACSKLRSNFPNKLDQNISIEYLSPGSQDYITSSQDYWSDNCWQYAGCIFTPSNAGDLAKGMSIITTSQTVFSVRSGGHDFNVNHSSVGHEGVQIDLSSLNDISLGRNKESVIVGVGARWGDVYQALSGSGVSVNGARSPNPGVGGQTLGGGIGWLTGMAGATAASLIGAEVVLANSTVIQVSEKHHPDLLWALRGGGGNFGIATSFTFKTLPIDKIWFEAKLYAADQNQALLNALVEYQQLASKDLRANVVFGLSQDSSAPQSFVGFLYLAPVESPPIFAPFSTIPAAEIMLNSTIGTLYDLSMGFYSPQYPEPGTVPLRHYVVSLPHKLDNSTYQESFRSFVSHAKKAMAAGWAINYGAQPISATAANASFNTPLGLELVDQDWVHVDIQWQSPEDDAAAMALIASIGKDIAKSADRHNAAVSYRFMNDAYDGQNVLSSYGKVNFRKLLAISKAFDPQGVFQRLQRGGWLLSREL
ncbi:FAD-binding domain-containing protein [Xylaria sp. FL1042]|nr:FAD-binding domain-containing protein [Xylaria sp. FL1042]